MQSELAEAQQARVRELAEAREQAERRIAETTEQQAQQATDTQLAEADVAAVQQQTDLERLRMSRSVRKVMSTSAGQDARLLADVVNNLQMPVATCRQIAVTSVRGGAGKTTVAALTASMAAMYRPDRVHTIDADTGLGSLPLRLGARAQPSLHDLAGARPGNWQDATRFLAQTSEGLWVLSGTTGGQLEVEQFQAAFAGISRYFSTTFVDCGAGIVNQLQRGILSGAHGQILVTPATVDGAFSRAVRHGAHDC